MLKDLPFYEVAGLADSKAHQACLEQREKKHQDGTLRQAPTTNHPTSNSTVQPPIKKKKGHVIQPIQRAKTPPFSSPSFLFALSSSSSSSSLAASTKPDTRVEQLGTSIEHEIGVELVVPPIVCKEEKEKDIDVNLRVGFKERQCKRLSQSIMVIHLPSKRPCLEPLYLELVLAIAPVSGPSIVVTGNNPKPNERLLSVERATHQEPGRPFSGLEYLSNDSVKCVASILSRPKSSHAPN